LNNNIKTECVILKKLPYKEKDLFVVLFSKDLGKILAKAKGGLKINSRWGSLLETMNLIKTNLYKRGDYFYITESKVIDTFINIKRDVEKSFIAMEILKLIDKTQTQNSDSEKIFQLLVSVLKAIKNTNSLKEYYYYFLLQLLVLEGILFPVEKCIKCGTKLEPPILFDKKEVGFVCKNCVSQSSEKIEKETWITLKSLLEGNFTEIEDLYNRIYRELFDILFSVYKSKFSIDIIDFEFA